MTYPQSPWDPPQHPEPRSVWDPPQHPEPRSVWDPPPHVQPQPAAYPLGAPPPPSTGYPPFGAYPPPPATGYPPYTAYPSGPATGFPPYGAYPSPYGYPQLLPTRTFGERYRGRFVWSFAIAGGLNFLGSLNSFTTEGTRWYHQGGLLITSVPRALAFAATVNLLVALWPSKEPTAHPAVRAAQARKAWKVGSALAGLAILLSIIGFELDDSWRSDQPRSPFTSTTAGPPTATAPTAAAPAGRAPGGG